jgi:hypothetical protein
MRDLVTANYVSQITENGLANFGCDCAALLEVGHLLNTEYQNQDPYLVYALGRSGHPRKLKAFAESVASELQITAVDMTWLEKGSSIDGTIDKISLLHHAQAVITDIYHCAITAWREGTPVLCIGQGANRVINTLSDKKKELLHLQMFAAQNYIYTEEIIKPGTKSIVQHSANVLRSTKQVNTASAAIDCQKTQALNKLISVLAS